MHAGLCSPELFITTCRRIRRHSSLTQASEVPDFCQALHMPGESTLFQKPSAVYIHKRLLIMQVSLCCTHVSPIADCPSVMAEHLLITLWTPLQVEDCTRDVCELSTYHFRYRICNVHIRLPAFMRQGKLQRFCQQCGRCHELSEFEGNQRSCRAQLDRHNARCCISCPAHGAGLESLL